MPQKEFSAIVPYLRDWSWYLIYLLFWGQAAALTFLLCAQFTLETAAAGKCEMAAAQVWGRGAAAAAFLLLLAVSGYRLATASLAVSPEIYWNLGVYAAEDGSPGKGIARFRSAEVEGENAADFHLDYAEALLQSGRFSDALSEAYAAAGESVRKESELGRIFVAMNSYRRARKAFIGALRQSPSDAYFLSSLADVDVRMGNKIEAIAIFKEILRSPGISSPVKAGLEREIRRLEEAR